MQENKLTVATMLEITIYKGYEIRTTPNGNGHISLVYDANGQFKAGTASDLTGENRLTSIEKAKIKIDNNFPLIQHYTNK
jgi:hypothetical protein